ncbi:MAG: hypothetical protein IJL91_08035 [Bacteroidales bacterium]|nr:hypothetical protein [Bacteroidales bacterium]
MELATIIIAAISILALYLSIDRKKQVENAAAHTAEEDPEYMEPLTLELIAKAVRCNGYVPEISGKKVLFHVNGEEYAIITGARNLLQFVKKRELTTEDDIHDIVEQAALRASQNPFEHVSVNGREISFSSGGIECRYGGLKENLGSYLRVIDFAISKFREQMDNLLEEKRKQSDSEEITPMTNPLGFKSDKTVLS